MRADVFAVLLLAAATSGCVTELDIEPTVPLDASVEAVFDAQAVDRILVTRADPQANSCVGVVMLRGAEDGIPGQDLSLPEPWGLELAYRRETAQECHGTFPQLHRVTVADSGQGYVDWSPASLGDDGLPTQLELDVLIAFRSTPTLESIEEGPVPIVGTVPDEL